MTYEPNSPITLAETVIQFDYGGVPLEMPAKALLRLSPSPRLVIECADRLHAEHMQLGILQSQLTASLFDTKIDFLVGQATTVFGESSGIALILLPMREPVSIRRSGERLSFVEFGVLNFPKFLGRQNKKVRTRNEWRVLGSVLLRVEDWEIEVSELASLRQNEATLKSEGGHAITHVGTVKRPDRSDFNVHDAEPLLSALQLFLSFARGAFCGLAIVVGKDAKGESAWEQWGTHRTTEWSQRPFSWFDRMNGDALEDVFPGFWRLFQEQKHEIRTLVNMYLNANLGSHGVGTDGSILLTQAALERLSYREMDRQTGQRIASALEKIGISKKALVISPEACPTLAMLASQNSWAHGPRALVEVRNSIAHPRRNIRRLDSKAYYEAWNLGQWYLELALLKSFGYEGKYGNGLIPRFVGEVEPLAQWLAQNQVPDIMS